MSADNTPLSRHDLGPALLFCPADRPERFIKAAERSDAVILDLEDAVAPEAKEQARSALADPANQLDPRRTIVRVNPVGTVDLRRDLEALKKTPYRRLMLAKTEEAHHVAALSGYEVIALVETARGVVFAEDIARQPNVVAMMWGAEDLIASMGGTSSRGTDGQYRHVALTARSRVLLAASAYGRLAIDSVYVNIPDLQGLAIESEDAVASGFGAKACIHPSQVAVVRSAYAPTPEEIQAAREVLAAAAIAGTGVFTFKGQMVDGPILRHAESVLARAATH